MGTGFQLHTGSIVISSYSELGEREGEGGGRERGKKPEEFWENKGWAERERSVKVNKDQEQQGML